MTATLTTPKCLPVESLKKASLKKEYEAVAKCRAEKA